MEAQSSSQIESFIADIAQPKAPSEHSTRARSPDSRSDTPSSRDELNSISMDEFAAHRTSHGHAHKTYQRTRRSIQSMPELDASFIAGGPETEDPAAHFDVVSYTDVDTGQKEEFQFLLRRESSWRRVCCHKGLAANLFFLIVMVVGIILGEVLYPLEGVRGSGRIIANDTDCLTNIEGCLVVRLVRAIGLFGFIGGITNWIAVEVIFVRVPFLVGTGVIAKQYKAIREGIRRIVVNTLFDPAAVREYFSDQKKHPVEIVHLEQHFGGLLNSAVANDLVEKKIDAALAGPEGFILTVMGVDHSQLKPIIRRNVQSFLVDISPIILKKMSPGLTDGEGLQAEVERILDQKIGDLSAKKVKQIVALMIHKHLSWLIVWGNLSGALIGLVAELATILAAKFSGAF